MRIMAIIIAVVLTPCCFLFWSMPRVKKGEQRGAPADKPIIDLLKDKTILLLMISFGIAAFGYFTPFIYAIKYAEDHLDITSSQGWRQSTIYSL